MATFTAVVNCAKPLDESGAPKYLRRLCGQPLLAILSDRLRQIRSIRHVLLVLHEPEPRTAEFARGVGWQVASTRQWRSCLAAPLLKLLRGDYWMIVDPDYPFLDPEACRAMASHIDLHRWGGLHMDRMAAFLPRLVLRRDMALRLLLKRLVNRSSVGFVEQAGRLAQTETACDVAPRVPAVASCLHADTVHAELIEYLGGLDMSVKSLTALESDPGFSRQKAFAMARDRLCAAMVESPSPHSWNRKLNRFESRHHMARVKSYPLDVAFNLTTVCNARCIFCNSPAVSNKAGHYLTLADFRSWSWLKYVSKVGLGGGIGDPLAHPEFLPIFQHLTEQYPHLNTRVITNGVGLSKAICNAFAGNLSRLRISLNAATPSTWQRLMGGRGFERVCDHIAYLNGVKTRQRTIWPEIRLLMVLNEQNADEIVAFAELARDLGAQTVEYHHFIPSLMPLSALSPRASLYYAKARADTELDLAWKRVRSSGIRLERPPAFRHECSYFEASRVTHAPDRCLAPWGTCLLAVDDQCGRQMFFCCVGLPTHIRYDKLDLTDSGFRRLWNHPTLHYFRKTVGSGPGNETCRFCLSEDRQDPDNTSVYRMPQRLHPRLAELHRRYLKTRLSPHFPGCADPLDDPGLPL